MSAMTQPTIPNHDVATVERLVGLLRNAVGEVSTVVLGQGQVVEQLFIGLICGGHVLLESPPGLGKTLLVRTIAQATGLTFSRIQFTPDLMPADITGSMTLVPTEDGRNKLEFQKGPIFTQLLLADEINRATPRTQSALLEAMQERTITAAGTSMTLPKPFNVLATQNPIEMEGTYALPEAQVDRFLFRVDINYPSVDTLSDILQATTGTTEQSASSTLTPNDILELQALVRAVPIADHVRHAVARFALMSQPSLSQAPADIQRYVRYGISPRGAQALVLAAKGHALLSGRYNVSFEDLRAVLSPATRHRVQLNFEGRAQGVKLDQLLKDVFEQSVKQSS